MARTAEQEIKTQPKPTYEQKPFMTRADSEDRVPMEVFRFFNMNPATDSDNEHLRLVNNWAKEGTNKTSGLLRKIRQLEMKLGQPKIGETRVSKLYNWIRMDSSIRDTSKSMRDEITAIKNRYKSEVSKIRGTFKERTAKIDTELSRILSEQRDTVKRARNRNFSEIKRIEKEYDKQLQELRSIRNAYKGR